MDDDWFSGNLTNSSPGDLNDFESSINQVSLSSSTTSLPEVFIDYNDRESIESDLQNIYHHLIARANMDSDLDGIDDYYSEGDNDSISFATFLLENDSDSWRHSDPDTNFEYSSDDQELAYFSERSETSMGNEVDENEDQESPYYSEHSVVSMDNEVDENEHRSISSSSQNDSDNEVDNDVQEVQVLELIPEQPLLTQQQQEQESDPEDDNLVQISKKAKLDVPEEKKEILSLNDTSDDDQKCPICLESWTNAGEHRLCSLKCGHLFGLSCINQWINKPQSAKNCPECKAKASKRDIRVLYAKKLVAIDTIETQKLQVQLNDALQKQNYFQQELDRHRSKEVVYKKELSNWQQRYYDLEKQLKLILAEKTALHISSENLCLTRNKIFDINGSCRVMAYNPWNHILAVSSDNAINRIFMELSMTPRPVNVHSNSIRDIAFQEQHPNFVLSVGFDKRVILTDIRTGCLTHSYKEETNLWSCCWSNYNQQSFFVGGANGTIIEYDIRFLQSNVSTKENLNDQSPVVSLASVPTTSPTLRAGGFLVCQLNSCSAYSFKEGNYIGNKINVEGPFLFLRYNEKDNHILLSCRANLKNPTVRHIVCTIEKKDDEIHLNKVHTFNGGNTQKLLSRPCFMNLPNDTLVIANNDSQKSLVGWSVSSGKESFSLPISEDALDLCAFECSGIYQAILTKSKLCLLKHEPS